ncbi:hypothetical protein B9Z55_028056 [Caenorhabditis nigoni]|uniref:F-box domain-containing protein n=1 Tax=Caenorhabditis nigoni TaxID=1611254 RepID=A0A2G5SD54_9PELO|nr:hypothetical protein B9Z55_028056 [Caenorhabditis nigoni]
MSKNAQENGTIERIKEAVKEEKYAIEKFPLLELPDLVRETVIRLMDPIEIFDFSQCSKRMRRTVKRSVRHKTYHLYLQAGKMYQIALYPAIYPEKKEKQAIFRVRKLNGDARRDPIYDRNLGNFQKIHGRFQESVLYLCHKSHFEITMALVAELMNLMTIKFHQVRMFLDAVENRDHRPLVEWLNGFPDGIKSTHISGDLVSNENMVDLMQTYQCSQTLRFFGRLDGFKIDHLPLKATDLSIAHTHWMTVDNVLQLDNVITFRLENARHFSDTDFNFILKRIISGALPKMVLAHFIPGRTYNRAVICQDIPMVRENSDRVFSRFPKVQIEDVGGFHFNLDNGDLGSIFFYTNVRAGMTLKGIGVIVWRPDA